MQFLKGLFWFLLAVLVAVFAIGNWTSVPIKLWGGLIADVNLPILLLVVFLAGLVPMLGYHHAVRWRLRQRLTNAERSLEALREAPATSPPAEARPPAAPLAAADPLPPSDGTAAPMPPGSA